ncbi:hypothetical protein ACPPTR_18025 [Ralstonia pseudosolanacearum]|uniref:hypothetical protein n=1 Tax=Ralstonia pseudosolanacearum TaxID=1310165 RepID=UPI0018D1F038|nr:hypothetical protein [Ralstonia pseudosolanacearum]
MKKRNPIFLFVAFLAVVAASSAYYRFLNQGELGEKDIYATLQEVELENRSSKMQGSPIFIENAKGSGYALLGMPSKNERYPYAWIVLNRISRDGSVFKMPPEVRGEVSCEFLENLTKKTKISGDVLRNLRSICSKQG